MSKILIVAAHPDDEVLGCGGTIARLIKEGHEAYTLILGEGITSRDEKRDVKRRKKEIDNLKDQVYKANKIMGVKDVFINNFPDNRFDDTPLLDIVKVIEKKKKEIKPEIIFTHHSNDLNIDHQITFEAVITAARPLKGESVKTIYSFEVMSSTEWNYPLTFSPNVFFDISSTIDKKLEAVEEYKSEKRPFPHPRSLKGIKSNASNWGVKMGVKHAEAFECIRCIR